MTTTNQQRARQKWYDDGPLCPGCGKNQRSVSSAIIGFTGLAIGYWRMCDDCLPAEVAEESRAIRVAFLGPQKT